MRILVLASAILVGAATASWGVELQYTFDQVAGSTVTNSGTWAGFNGTLATKGTVGAIVGPLPSVAQWGKAVGGQYLVGLSGNVLHSNTTIGSGSLSYPFSLPPADGTGFYTPESAGGNNVETNCSVSFWIKSGATINGDFVGIAGAQAGNQGGPEADIRKYNAPTPAGTWAGQDWYIKPGGVPNTGLPRIQPYGDQLTNWHFYTYTFTNGGVNNGYLYKDGVWIGQEEWNGSRDATMGIAGDGLGLRVGGHSFGTNVFIDNLQFTTTVMNPAQAQALFDAQFVPEPTAAMLLLAGAALFGVRRRRT